MGTPLTALDASEVLGRAERLYEELISPGHDHPPLEETTGDQIRGARPRAGVGGTGARDGYETDRD